VLVKLTCVVVFVCFQIVSWIEDLPNTCDGRCAVQVIGKSYENRDIYVIRISGNISESSNRPVLFFETNIHAREWLSHASVAFVVQSVSFIFDFELFCNTLQQLQISLNWHNSSKLCAFCIEVDQ
jgi:hypothetical protein